MECLINYYGKIAKLMESKSYQVDYEEFGFKTIAQSTHKLNHRDEHIHKPYP